MDFVNCAVILTEVTLRFSLFSFSCITPDRVFFFFYISCHAAAVIRTDRAVRRRRGFYVQKCQPHLCCQEKPWAQTHTLKFQPHKRLSLAGWADPGAGRRNLSGRSWATVRRKETATCRDSSRRCSFCESENSDFLFFRWFRWLVCSKTHHANNTSATPGLLFEAKLLQNQQLHTVAKMWNYNVTWRDTLFPKLTAVKLWLSLDSLSLAFVCVLLTSVRFMDSF